MTTWFERGAAYVSRAYQDALAPSFDVQIYARGGEAQARNNPAWDAANVWWMPFRPGRGTWIDREDFERWGRTRGIRVVLFNEQQWWPPVLWARELGLRTIAYVDYYTAETVPRFWAYDALWCNTRRHYSVFEKHPGARYIPWGSDLQLFSPRPRPADGDLVFFHSAGMGGMNLRKGTDLLVAAFQQVRGPVRLIIHSQVPLTTYGQAADIIRGDHRIRFIEATVPAPGLYHLGDVYVYPSRLEGIGLSVVEAISCGLPVIATDTAPCNEFVVPGSTGWLVPVVSTRQRPDGYYWPEAECDTRALTRVMQWCVDHRAEAVQWRERARSFAEQHFDWRANAASLPGAVHELMATPPIRIPTAVRREMQRESRAELGPRFREEAYHALRAGDYHRAWLYYARLARTDPSALRDKQLLLDLLSLCKRSSLAVFRR